MDLLHKYLPLPHSFAIFWAGSSIAIAIEAKSKFKAKTLEKKVAFDVGRHVFKSQARLEWLLLFTAWLSQLTHFGFTNFTALTIATFSFLTNQFIFSPILMRRADAIIKGETVPPGNSHAVLVGFEIVKCLALLRV
ncbi:uncharacterized protein LOC135144503 isoform X1 [Zophobas morio]|uniref:uncharacterized protein LOC135144503 isoform X1 n=1 Tax=Zophobas morio TaxID=2755281 RepID=UPI0030828477